MSRTHKRIDQFALPTRGYWSRVSFSDNLVGAGMRLLESELEDEHGASVDLKSHAISGGPGCILLVVTGFDLWLTEAMLNLHLDEAETHEWLARNAIQKYRDLYGRFQTIERPRCIEDLTAAVEIRHEIAHHHPRPIEERRYLPDWFPRLHKKGLFITTDTPGSDFNFSQKLTSYALAYWVCDVINQAARELLDGSPAPAAEMARFGLDNFSRVRDLPCPY